MAYGDLKCRNLIWNSGSGDNTVVLSTLATQSYVTTNFAPKSNPTFAGTINGADLVLSGNLTVSGTQTIINTNVLQVEDKHIEIGKVSSPSDTTADGGGIILKASSDRTFVWINSTDAWTSSEHIQVASGKTFIGDGSTLTALNASNLGSGTVPTARLGSGTAGSSNYLRGDGSWQTIDLSAKANLSGATFTGNLITPTADVRGTASINTDGMQFSFSAPEGHIKTKNSSGAPASNLAFHTTNASGNTNRVLHLSHSGAISVGGNSNYGSSGQVLTSGGSGAAPSWTTISAAPEITATASGAIPANKIVVVNSNGTVSEGKETISLLNPSTKGTEFISNATAADRMDFCFDKTNKQYFYSLSDYGNTYYEAGQINASGNFTTLLAGTVELNTLDSCCIYDEEGEVIYFIYHDNASNGQTRMKLYNTANDTLSAESIVFSQWQSAGITDMTGIYEPKYKFVIFQGKAEGSGNKLAIFTMYTDTNKTSKNNNGDGYYAGSPSDDYLIRDDNGIAVDNDGHMVSIFTRNSYYPYYRIKTFTGGPALNGNVPGTWMTGTTRVNTTNTNCSCVQVAYDASADKFVLAWRENNGDIKARTGTITGSGSSISLSLGTELTVATGTANGAVSLVADTSVNATCIGYMDSNQYLSVNYLTISGTNLTKNSTALVASSTAAYKYAEGAKGFPATFDTFRGRAVFGYIDNNSRNKMISILNGTNSTNITASNVIGTSGSAFADTATATVQVAGNSNTGQSGLTAGLKYYVQRDGTLASTADPNLGTIEAGIALSSTKLLIKG